MTQTAEQYQKVIAFSKSLFIQKHQDYGSAWRILRLSSLTDQIFIKAKRIRSIQEVGKQEIADSINSEFVAIINYAIMALMQIDLEEKQHFSQDLSLEEVNKLYDENANHTLTLLLKKNHDYGEAWREMRVSSMTDLILMKIRRIKQIEDNQGLTLVSEGVAANYQDILNYAVFCLIHLNFLENELSH
ncbi:MAG: DUF1599 domain-containing protein [Thermonemataceae bacterium]|nr:DUF1599 domain-containing protein [Thermonemataceae bacterium]